MTGKTLADHSRAYRTRKAERIARMEARVALLEEVLREVEHAESKEIARHIARNALAKPTNT